MSRIFARNFIVNFNFFKRKKKPKYNLGDLVIFTAEYSAGYYKYERGTICRIVDVNSFNDGKEYTISPFFKTSFDFSMPKSNITIFTSQEQKWLFVKDNELIPFKIKKCPKYLKNN